MFEFLVIAGGDKRSRKHLLFFVMVRAPDKKKFLLEQTCERREQLFEYLLESRPVENDKHELSCTGDKCNVMFLGTAACTCWVVVCS